MIYKGNLIQLLDILVQLDSQSHRITGIGRDLWRSSNSNRMIKKVDIEEGEQDL